MLPRMNEDGNDIRILLHFPDQGRNFDKIRSRPNYTEDLHYNTPIGMKEIKGEVILISLLLQIK